ncbi:MAG: hypothetical protein BLITH_1316 [Brockia lithotrophica]|uniref:Uncharacterized protein n=1 Tax=Brockia lithotrophica TaxID=933949 RepID=A0A2T5G675_9BACL|nr:MAG: hypothetical protein BLITH_1316 [Brockia lithotrophica]
MPFILLFRLFTFDCPKTASDRDKQADFSREQFPPRSS